MKPIRIGLILQMIYCACCLIVVVCMPLYAAFYETAFGVMCFRIGAVLTLVSTFNPMGLIGTILTFGIPAGMDPKETKKRKLWAIISPFFVILSWLLAVCFFVEFSGGV